LFFYKKVEECPCYFQKNGRKKKKMYFTEGRFYAKTKKWKGLSMTYPAYRQTYFASESVRFSVLAELFSLKWHKTVGETGTDCLLSVKK